MDEQYAPRSDAQLVDLITWALAKDKTLNLQGQGTKAGFGMPTTADCTVALHRLTGIIAYESAELVMTARPGTPLAEIDVALAAQGQHLAFEPMRLGRLYGVDERMGTVGGVFMGNLSGPRRFKAGAARDHILGIKAVNGRGEVYKSGGAVIKNVTGYDLSKLLSGSWGTLSLLTEITFKVLPAPATSTTLSIREQELDAALATLNKLAHSPYEPSGLAYIPAKTLELFGIESLRETQGALTALRFEGSMLSVRERIRDVERHFSEGCESEIIDAEQSVCFWEAIRDVAPFKAPDQRGTVLKISLPPARAGKLVHELQQLHQCRWFLDAAGGWFWVALGDAEPDEAIEALRSFLDEDGTLVLYRATDATKEAVGVLSMPPALMSLSKRLKRAFDPKCVFNPGRLFPV